LRKLILAAVLGFSILARPEGNVGNGGDADVAEFVSLGRVLVRVVQSHSATFPEFDFSQLEETVEQTKVGVSKRTFLKGKEVDGINWSQPKRIRFSRTRWKEMSSDIVRKTRFVLHEYLGVMKKEINHYRISSRLQREHLRDLLSPEFTLERRNSLVVNLCYGFEKPAQDACHLEGFARMNSAPVIDLPETRAQWSLETLKSLCGLGPSVAKQLECLQIGMEHTLSTVHLEEAPSGGTSPKLQGVMLAFEEGLGSCNKKFENGEALKECLESTVVLAILFLN
jgi:hypothetical protein